MRIKKAESVFLYFISAEVIVSGILWPHSPVTHHVSEGQINKEKQCAAALYASTDPLLSSLIHTRPVFYYCYA